MRRALALAALALLAVTAGCASPFGPPEPDEAELAANASYDWSADVNASFDLEKREYAAVFRVENRTEFTVYRRDGLGTENPLSVSALKFRYPNGTVVNASALNVENTRKRTTITLPAAEGQVAYTASRQGKRFSVPTFVTGTYEMTLPPGARVGLPLLSQVHPRGYSTSRADNRVTVHWPDVGSRSVLVRYYLVRDLLLFGGLFVILLLVGVGGTLYYLRSIRALERRREDVGLDVETDDDPGRRGPPPGMG